jgi:hypothetical protein
VFSKKKKLYFVDCEYKGFYSSEHPSPGRLWTQASQQNSWQLFEAQQNIYYLYNIYNDFIKRRQRLWKKKTLFQYSVYFPAFLGGLDSRVGSVNPYR